MTEHPPIIPKEYKPFEDMPVEERIAALKNARELLGGSGRPTDMLLSMDFVRKINKKFDHIGVKSTKKGRKVSR